MLNQLASPPSTNLPDIVQAYLPSLEFNLPAALEASEPPEARGMRRDDVRLMVSHYGDNRVTHTHFHQLANWLNAGDVLVINTSGTMNAAIPAERRDGSQFELHLSTQLPTRFWVVELREVTPNGTVPFFDLKVDEQFTLPAGGTVTLRKPYCGRDTENCERPRLWMAELDLPIELHRYLSEAGFPIRYNYVKLEWPIDYYQTVFATELGSAEMPSAGRAFTHELLTSLVAKGVQIAPLLLHTGVASLEAHEPPYEEYFQVPSITADIVNRAREQGRRVVAVGTTAVRALESAVDANGKVTPSSGWTDLVITPERELVAVDGMLTGLHEPQATHLAMLAALSGFEHLKYTYAAALEEKYLWHEFGDLHLILP